MMSFRVVVDIALACVALISGGANPEVVDHTSSLADGDGFVVPIPILYVDLSIANAQVASIPKSAP